MTLEPANVEKRKIGLYAQHTLERAHEISRRGSALLNAPTRLRKIVERRAEALTSGQTEGRLGDIPITELGKLAKPGIGIPALERAGYRTVAELDSATDHDLMSIRGVAKRTVREVRKAIANLSDEVIAAARIRLDPDERGDAETSLLTAWSPNARLRRPVGPRV
ncbi:MAG TPA: DNA-directed RNA polymerase subunit alpha C-terminal domain-containing protein, partial [Glycomyces sp.]|nr:DNA-directed RNA polymerase subunit alpha C-terminal domain-containing protein [Glycomyces sp.]